MRKLSAGVDESTWVLTSYLVANAIVLPLSAWFSSILGRKNYYMLSVVIFTLSSCLCGLAPSLGWLVVFRIMQGFGGGGLQPSEQAILADTFPVEKLGMGMAVYGVAVVTAPIIGPRTMEQLNGSMKALKIKLGKKEMDALDALFPGPGGTAPEAYAW